MRRLLCGVADALFRQLRALRRACYESIERTALYRRVAAHPLGARLLFDVVFRAHVILYLSLLVNAVYGLLQFLVGLHSKSMWLGALSVYHELLAVMQFMLMRHVQRYGTGADAAGEWRKYRLCGVALLLMTPIFASILILIVHKNSRAGYPGFLIYFAAVYAFCKTGMAVASVRKFRQFGSPVLSAAKALSLIAAMISILSLETAVLSRYGHTHGPVFYQAMLGTAGGAVCVFILGEAVHMIVRASRNLRGIRQSAALPKSSN